MPEAGMPGALAYARHRLAWLDQVAFELFRVTGRCQLMQCLWLYDRDINRDALEQTNQRLFALSRLIEPSPLPWGRPRWVKPSGGPTPIQANADVLPRARLLHWANQHARVPIDPVAGPAWRMAVQKFDDGSTAVSAVGSHLVIDGMGAVRALAAAANGTDIPDTYLSQGSRGWLAGCVADARQILADAPRTLAALAGIVQAGARRPLTPVQRPSEKAAHAPYDRTALVELPAVVAAVDTRTWNDCARRLGGRAYTLLPGFVATLAAHLGRCRPSDGAVSLLVPINRRRGLEDDRALAIEFRTMTVAPAGLANSLRPLELPLRAMLLEAKDQAGALAPLLPAIAWMPRALTTVLVNRLFAYGDERPVSCSDLGTLPDGLACIDGAPCARVLTRAVDVNVTRSELERSHGHLVVVASRYNETVSLCIEACQLDPDPTTTEALRRATVRTLADFGLDAVVEA